MKKILCLLFGLLLLSGCRRHVLSDDEFRALDKAILDYTFDWTELDEMPKGMTLYFYPCDQEPVDTTIHCIVTNNVTRLHVELPEQDYAVIVFNRTEKEHPNLKFDLSAFETATIRAKSEEEAAQRNKKGGTRAYNISGSIIPKDIAAGTTSSVKKKTRAYNVSGTIIPKTPAKNLSLSVNVFGLNNSVSVSGSLTNLSAGVMLKNFEPLNERINQPLPSETWTITLPETSDLPGTVTCNLGTFGVPLANHKFETRGIDAEADTIRNILLMNFKLPDGETVTFAKDVTDRLRSEFERILEQQENGTNTDDITEMEISLGKPDDPFGTNDAQEDGETELGSFILHQTTEGLNVKIQGWDNKVIPIGW